MASAGGHAPDMRLCPDGRPGADALLAVVPALRLLTTAYGRIDLSPAALLLTSSEVKETTKGQAPGPQMAVDRPDQRCVMRIGPRLIAGAPVHAGRRAGPQGLPST